MASEVADSESPEAKAMEAGIALDVTGSGLTHLEPTQVDAVLRTFPRGPFAPEFSRLMQEEPTRKPASAAATLLSKGLLDRIADSPLKDSPPRS